ncbi:MAG TPA: hypothetical protein VJ729_08285 [Nitrososphaeraceae archaeon]|nr:hypothetical protein [Nitrososphaeraceae archaeon]
MRIISRHEKGCKYDDGWTASAYISRKKSSTKNEMWIYHSEKD